MRPDLFDPHTVHFHGFPQRRRSSTACRGLVRRQHGGDVTYFYNIVEPGTFIYHCHVEATEHMEMGMLGQLYVRPAAGRDGAGL